MNTSCPLEIAAVHVMIPQLICAFLFGAEQFANCIPDELHAMSTSSPRTDMRHPPVPVTADAFSSDAHPIQSPFLKSLAANKPNPAVRILLFFTWKRGVRSTPSLILYVISHSAVDTRRHLHLVGDRVPYL